MSAASQILVPVDFSEQSIIALKQSFNLARLTKSDITLLHVIDDDYLDRIYEIIQVKTRYQEHVKEVILKKLEELADKTSHESGVKVHYEIQYGKIYDQINAASERINPVFIIMGTNGASTLMKKFIGSNALRVIREAKVPVITIRGKEHRFGCKNIVLPLDLTKETKEKVNKAIELAGLFGSAIHIISVKYTSDEFLVNKLTRQFNQVKHFVENSGVSCFGVIVDGKDVAEETIRYAKKTDADLIIIMTQQELYWTELFIGSAAQEIINNSEIPVLCIKPVAKRDLTEFVTS